jgi:hypothetical protein
MADGGKAPADNPARWWRKGMKLVLWPLIYGSIPMSLSSGFATDTPTKPVEQRSSPFRRWNCHRGFSLPDSSSSGFR